MYLQRNTEIRSFDYEKTYGQNIKNIMLHQHYPTVEFLVLFKLGIY